MTNRVIVRPAREADARALAAMVNRLNVATGLSDGVHSAETVKRDAFGPAPLFEALIAEADGRPVGYAYFQNFYDSDRAGPGVLLLDLYVDEAARGSGAGRALMAALARTAKARGAASMTWGVLDANAGAIAFYERLGARDVQARIFEINEDALAKLADEGRIEIE